MFPQIRDSGDEALALLKKIAANTAATNDPDRQAFASSTFGGTGPAPTPENLVVVETSNLDDANADGAITVNDGETATVVEYENFGNQMAYLVALGAHDVLDTTYKLVVEGDERFTTESPLGGVNSLFSFTETLGQPLPVGSRVRYDVTYTGGGSTDYVGRMLIIDT
jgi:hypothetical protein